MKKKSVLQKFKNGVFKVQDFGNFELSPMHDDGDDDKESILIRVYTFPF